MTTRTDPQTNFRMPASLRERLKLAAAKNRRSFNAEIVLRLESTLEAENKKAPSVETAQGFSST